MEGFWKFKEAGHAIEKARIGSEYGYGDLYIFWIADDMFFSEKKILEK